MKEILQLTALQLGAAIGTHIGPHAFGSVYVGKE